MPKHIPKSLISRRELLRFAGASLVLLVTPLAQAANERLPGILAVRVWPAADYTRVAIECHTPIKFTHFTVKDPERLVVDLEGIEFNAVLEELSSKVASDDPNIKLLRAGRFKPGVVRLVMELKNEVKPQVFVLKPVGKYGYRLVLDVYPLVPPDPLQQWIEQMALNDNPETSIDNAVSKSNVETPEIGANPPNSTALAKHNNSVTSRMLTIMLDPGHGGEDPGAIGYGGTHEKQIVLAIAKRLQAKIDAEPNMRAILTRDTDFFVPLNMRVQKARRVRADLFISIHADAALRTDASGSSVFVLSESGASSSAARYLAQKENDADLVGGVNFNVKDSALARTLLDLSQTATISDSLKLAKAVLNEVSKINRLHKNNVEQAGFAVLKSPDIPSILIETAFISNPAEEKRLKTSAYQNQMASAIFAGIRQYFAKNPPLKK